MNCTPCSHPSLPPPPLPSQNNNIRRHEPVSAPAVEEVEKDNRDLVDLNTSQALTTKDIEAMKASGKVGRGGCVCVGTSARGPRFWQQHSRGWGWGEGGCELQKQQQQQARHSSAVFVACHASLMPDQAAARRQSPCDGLQPSPLTRLPF